ncbi:MAG: TolC family protein [Gemmataceae bacterium]|nr:TolC family protein [Gemmataceae bacterium]
MEDRSRLGKWGKPALCLALALVLAGFGGCTRRFYRERADKEVAVILADKDKYPQWKIENFHVYPHPRARFGDPSDPDHPPMPPDDPAAADLAPQPQRPGKAGVVRIEGTGYLDLLRLWDAQNRGEDPATAQHAAEGSEQRPFLLTLEQASELGLINSREFQTRRENLYLTALPVSLERFAFAAQFFALETAIRERAGRESSAGQTNRWRLLSDGGFTKLFSTGALLLFRFANDTVINLTGPGPHTTSVSTINLDFVQPFLRGGGKAVTLEPLTQVERNLVYEIRDYARFRKQFYTFIAGGFDLPSLSALISRLGGGLTPGATTTVGTTRPQILPGGAGRLDLALDFFAPAEGYLPNLLRAAFLANERKNVDSLTELLTRFRELEKGGTVAPLQVGTVKQQLLDGESTVLQRQQELRDGLDNFKLQLGLPVNVPLDLDQQAVRPLQEHFRRYEKIFADFKAVMADLKAASTQMEKTLLAGRPELVRMRGHLRRLFTESALAGGTAFSKEILDRWDEWAKSSVSDSELPRRLADLVNQRTKLLKLKEELEDQGKPFTPKQQQALRQLDHQIETGGLEQAMRAYEGEPWKALPEEQGLDASAAASLATAQPAAGLALALRALMKDPPLEEWLELSGPAIDTLRDDLRARRKAAHAEIFQVLSDAFELVLIEARSQRLGPLRERWPALPAVELDGSDLLKVELDESLQRGAQAALVNRFDLMNARGQLHDTWRQLAIFANSLLGTFDVAYHLDSATPAGQAKPLAFSGSRSRHQLILNTELPLVRRAERNNYRASLIAYQRERRNLMAAEDLTAAGVRAELRALRVLAQNYKIQQEAVDLAYQVRESAEEEFFGPPVPGGGQDAATRAAALTQQVLNAQARLVRAQNLLYTFWINFLLTRLQLYRDLELMPLDPRGVWIDELATRQRGPQSPGSPGPGQPADGQRDGGLEGASAPGPLEAPPAAPLE